MANLRPLAAELRAISSCVLGLELELIQAVVEELQLQRAALSQMAIAIDGHDVEIARRNTMRDARMPRCQLRFVVRPLEGVANFIDARIAAKRREERQKIGRASCRERVCQYV